MIEREEDQEKNRGFKVDDRRRFSAEGSSRRSIKRGSRTTSCTGGRGAAAAAAGTSHPGSGPRTES